MLKSDVDHERGLVLRNVVGEMLSRVAPAKTEPSADISPCGQAIKPAAGHLGQPVGSGERSGDSKAAAGKGSQAQKGASVHRSQIRHKVRELRSVLPAKQD